MSFQPVDIPGLPPEISVRRSTRRRRSVGAHREGDTTVVTIPHRMPLAEADRHARALHSQLTARITRRRRSDADLFERAEQLRKRYLPEAPSPSSVAWSSRQQQRWGSCTPADKSIRLSQRLIDMPRYVVDSVLVHELAHLVSASHGPEFTELVARFPDTERANAFLAGVAFGTNQTSADPTWSPATSPGENTF